VTVDKQVEDKTLGHDELLIASRVKYSSKQASVYTRTNSKTSILQLCVGKLDDKRVR
jgi:hypothetical protein